MGYNVRYAYGDWHLIIRANAGGTSIIQFNLTEWSLTSLQMNMFKLWFRVSTRFSVKFTVGCVKVGPWYITNDCLKYDSNEIDFVVRRVRVVTDYNNEVRIYNEDHLHCHTLNTDNIRTLIALTMTMNGAHLLY